MLQYSPTGHIVYADRATDLFAVRFDVGRLTAAGAPVKLLERVDTVPRNGEGNFALSAGGTLVFGRNRRRRAERWCGPIVRASPRQSRSSRGRSGHRACRRTAGNLPSSSMTTGVGISGSIVSTTPRFSRSPPKDSTARPCGPGTGCVLPISPSATASATSCRSQAIRARRPKACSRARAMISFPAAGRQTAVRSSSSIVRRLITQKFACCRSRGDRSRPCPGIPVRSNRPAISPDGRWLAFGVPPSTGRPAIYVRPFPGPGPSRQFVDAAGQPVWSRDGEKIFFRSRRGATPASSGDGIFEMPFDRSRGIAAGPERQLFRKAFAEDANDRALPATTSRLTVDSCWSFPTSRNRFDLT